MDNYLRYSLYFLYSLSLSFLGFLSNIFVIINNDLLMPVRSSVEISSSMHFAYESFSEVNYWFLTDFLSVGGHIFSIGDLLIWTGIFGCFISLCFGSYYSLS